MFYVFSYTPNAADTKSSPHKIDMRLAAGVIHQVDILFQDGSEHKEFVKIFNDALQLWPSNREENLRGNATAISFRDFFELRPGNTRLTAEIYTTLAADFKEIIIQIGVLPKRVLQPLSFEELLAAAAGY